jgi:putative tryptophan/tyrosine transport system substrate-binding protein
VRRREFIVLLGGAVAGWPVHSRAQQAPVIGFLSAASRDATQTPPQVAAFRNGLKEAGYVEGSVIIEFRFAENQADRLPALAEELVRLKPRLILAGQTAAAIAAKRVTTTIPIIAAQLIDPVGLGLVVSEARPGGNVTGILASLDSLPGKAIEILREMVPQATRIGVLVNIGNPQNPGQARDAAVAMANSPVKVVPVEVRSVDDLDAAFATLAREQVQAVLVLPDSLFTGERRRIATLAIAGRLPTMSSERYNVEEGALIS